MSCVLRIEGNDFDVDAFLEATDLRAYKIWNRGATIVPKRKDGSIHTRSGCNIAVSEADFDKFETQKADAVKFLSDNYNQLQRVTEFGLQTTECGHLDFGVSRKPNVFVQSDCFEPELLRLAGNLNFTIEISQYDADEEQ